SAAREALLVTNSLRVCAASRAAMAPSVGSWPRNTVPSRSSSRQSCCCARVVTSGQLADPVFGIRDTVEVGGGRVDEPLQRFVATVERQQRLGVGVEQACGGRTGTRRVRLRAGQHGQGLFELTEIGAGTGRHDPQLIGVVTTELRSLGAPSQLDGTFRPANA